jgi:hypothetical protein
MRNRLLEVGIGNGEGDNLFQQSVLTVELHITPPLMFVDWSASWMLTTNLIAAPNGQPVNKSGPTSNSK